MCTRTHTCTHAHARAHTCTQTCTHTHAQTHMCLKTSALALCWSSHPPTSPALWISREACSVWRIVCAQHRCARTEITSPCAHTRSVHGACMCLYACLHTFTAVRIHLHARVSVPLSRCLRIYHAPCRRLELYDFANMHNHKSRNKLTYTRAHAYIHMHACTHTCRTPARTHTQTQTNAVR